MKDFGSLKKESFGVVSETGKEEREEEIAGLFKEIFCKERTEKKPFSQSAFFLPFTQLEANFTVGKVVSFPTPYDTLSFAFPSESFASSHKLILPAFSPSVYLVPGLDVLPKFRPSVSDHKDSLLHYIGNFHVVFFFITTTRELQHFLST